MDASLRWHDEEEKAVGKRMDASLRPLLHIRAPAALVRPEHRWHDESTAAVQQSSFQRKLESIVRWT